MKKTLSLFLALLMLLSCLALTLASCNEEETNEKEKDVPHNGPVEVVEGDIFSERAAVDDELGEYDFGERQLRFVAYSSNEVFVPEEDRNQGNLITDAIFDRNRAVEDRFNFEVAVVYTGSFTEVADWVSKSVLSGVDEFDVLSQMAADAGKLVLKNLFLNWYDIPNVDFSKPWWAKSCTEDLTYDGKAILAVSDFNSSAVTGTHCMIFNKNLANAYDMGNLYEVALSGDWTYEYFYNLIKDVYVDSDGSGTPTEGDFYGFEQSHWWGTTISSWLYAFDNPTVKKDEEGIPSIAIKTDKINNIVSTIYDLCYNTNGAHYTTDDSANNPLFFAKRAIFAITNVGAPTGEALRNFEDEYGLLPMPKWDGTQKNYTSAALGSHSCLAIPKTVKDTEFVGTCIEALSAESYKKVIPTIYEIALKTRYLRDNESKEVLDLVLDNRIYDFGILYGDWKGFEFCLSTLMGEGNPNFESYYDKNYTTARFHYRSIVKAFDRLK